MKTRNKLLLTMSICSLLVLVVFPGMVMSHCEIPCGIYDDPMRIKMMAENIDTIEKSMQEINSLGKNSEQNPNQLVRWIMNKEHHADYLSDTVTQYFMKQRIKPVESTAGKDYQDYIKRLTLLHRLMVYSMRCKQTTDVENVPKLREYLDQFSQAYLGQPSSAFTGDHGLPHTH